MKKRLLVIVLATAGILGAHGAATAEERAENGRRDWACIFFTDLDQGVCQRNPLPERLPVPDEATLPEVPEVAVPETTAPEVAVPEAPSVVAPDASSVSAPSVPSAPTL